MSIEDEFPPEEALSFDKQLADAYTRLRARAAEMERALQRIAEMSQFNDNSIELRIAREALPPDPEPHQNKPCQTTN